MFSIKIEQDEKFQTVVHRGVNKKRCMNFMQGPPDIRFSFVQRIRFRYVGLAGSEIELLLQIPKD